MRRMRAVIQRVSEAAVSIGGEGISRIGPGLLVLLGIEEVDLNEMMVYLNCQAPYEATGLPKKNWRS